MQSFQMLCASFLFAIMGVCVKLASDLYLTSEIVMFRGLIGVLCMLVLIRCNGGTLIHSGGPAPTPAWIRNR